MNIRWIVCFKGDDNHNNTLLCTDLGEVKLKNVFSEISESTEGILTKFVISDYDSTKDPLNIRETQHNPSWNDDTADACAQGCKQIKYRTITVPVGKSLFMEVIHLTPYTQTNFTDAEVCDILEHLLIFLDNKKLILRALCQQMALDCGLYDRINSLLLGLRTEPAQLHSKLLDLALEIGKHICLSVKDHRGNAMLALNEEDINERLLVDINLSEINRLFVPTVLITSSDFLVHNDDSLCELYANKQSDCEFTVDIELPVLPSDTAAQRLSEVLMCRFLALDSTKKIVIRFRGLECDFNLNFIHGKEIRAVFENCTLMRGSCSHINLKELTIVNSKITASLVLPDGMEKVTLKNVNVAANGKLRLGRNCKTVVMRNVSGNICVPYLQQNFCIEFNSQWSFELSGHDDEHIGRLLIENVTISGLLVVINQSVHTVILKNIILPSNSILLVQKSVKELLLETFLGTVHLYGAVQAFGPICVEVFDGKLKVEESGIGKRTKIALERAKLTKNAHLDKKISHVDLCDVEIAAGCSLKLHGSEQHISLKNCTGTVFFANIPGFEQIKFGRTLQAEDHLGVIPVQVFLCTRTVMGRMSRLVLHFLQFEENVRLCDNTKDIILKNIEIHDEYSLVVGNNFEQLTLQNCRGRVVIPGVSFSEGKQTGLLLNGGQIRIVRLPDDIYDITAENIQFTGDLAFAMRVHAAEICNAGMCADSTITFANECQSLNLQGNVACIRVLAATTLKTLSLRGTDVSNNSQLLAVPVERFTAENVTMHHRTMSRADVPSVLTSLNIANRSTMVSITNTNVPVNITSIVRHVIRGESPLLTTPDSVFCLNEDPSVQLNELHLAHFHVHSNLEIVREILSLSLKEITAGSNSTIRVNKELESITIDNCLVNIDFTETRGLRSIVLSRTALIYNQVLHLPISYLSLSSVVIDQNVSLNECVKTAKLKDVRIEKDYTFKVNRNIHELDISGSVGIVNMSGIGGLDSMVLEQKHQIRVINGNTPNVTFLYISDYHFNNNMVLPNDIGTVFLRNVNIPSDHKLVLGNNCQHMVIESSHVRTELSRLTLLKSVILKRMQPAVLKTVLAMFSSVSKIIVLDMVVYSGTVLSIGANIVAVRLQGVTCYGEFRDGEKCSEISLLHCSGKYDFSKVALLKKLILIPMLEKTHPFVVVFPPLGHVEDLEIAYNFADAYFKDVLLKCVNLQRLIIHGLCLSDTNPAYSTPIFPNEVFHIPINDWQLEEKFTSYSARTERMYNQEEKKEIMNLKMNALVKIVFGVNMYSKLKSLKLLGFGLDGDNVELLRKFKALQTLFVDYDFSDKMLFAHLPAGLMTLEITRRKNLVCVNPEPKTFDPIALEHLKKQKNLRNLSLCGVLCADGNILQYLPAKLHVLKVTWSPVKAFNKFDGNITKRIVKKLILFLNDDFNNVGFGGNLIRKQCRDVFNYLGQFILFDALEELVVEKKHKMVSINPKTFKIK